MLRFHANLYARPAGLVLGKAIALRHTSIRPLDWSDPNRVFRRPLPLSFDEAADRLRQLEGVDVEPDGFFIATGQVGSDRWRVSGQLFEFDGSLHRVTLHGECSQTDFDRLVDCLRQQPGDDPQASLVYELIEEGVVLCEEQFCRWAAASPD